MNVSSVLNKQNIVKIGVVAVALAFLLETFAFGGGRQNPSNNQPGNLPPVDTQPLAGTALVNGTVQGYGSELYVQNADEKARALIDELKAEGTVLYPAKFGANVTVLNLARKANVTELTARFAQTNTTSSVLARTSIKMPLLIEFATPQGLKNATFEDISINTPGLAPVGSNITISLRATLQGGLVSSYSAELYAPSSEAPRVRVNLTQ